MKKILFTPLCLLLVASAFAQTPSLTNVRVRVDSLAKTIAILYDAQGITPDDSVGVVIRRRSGIVPNPTLRGDVGRNVDFGPDRRIDWDVAKDKFNLNEEIRVELTVYRSEPPRVVRVESDQVERRESPSHKPNSGNEKKRLNPARLLIGGGVAVGAGVGAVLIRSGYQSKLSTLQQISAEADPTNTGFITDPAQFARYTQAYDAAASARKTGLYYGCLGLAAVAVVYEGIQLISSKSRTSSFQFTPATGAIGAGVSLSF